MSKARPHLREAAVWQEHRSSPSCPFALLPWPRVLGVFFFLYFLEYVSSNIPKVNTFFFFKKNGFTEG